MLTSGAGFLHDTWRPHIGAHTQALPEHFNWELSDLPPDSLVLALSNYHLFAYLKNWL
jgi:hypothetical protein